MPKKGRLQKERKPVIEMRTSKNGEKQDEDLVATPWNG